MGFLDKIKDQASGLKDKAVDTAAKNSDKITVGLDKAGDFVDKQTKGKYTDKIKTGKVKAKQGLEKLESRTPAGRPPLRHRRAQMPSAPGLPARARTSPTPLPRRSRSDPAPVEVRLRGRFGRLLGADGG